MKGYLVLNRLLNTLTEALQSSGVDLSQASISVQIELGKQSNGRATRPPSVVKVYKYINILHHNWYSKSLFK